MILVGNYHTIQCVGHLLLGYRVRDFQVVAGCFPFGPGAWGQVRVRVFFPCLWSLTWSQIRVRVLFPRPFYPRLPTLSITETAVRLWTGSAPVPSGTVPLSLEVPFSNQQKTSVFIFFNFPLLI